MKLECTGKVNSKFYEINLSLNKNHIISIPLYFVFSKYLIYTIVVNVVNYEKDVLLIHQIIKYLAKQRYWEIRMRLKLIVSMKIN